MSISLGIYDIYSYMLPGSVYLLIIFRAFGLFDTIQQIEFDLAQLIAFLVLSFLAGVLFDPIATRFWYYRFFAQKDANCAIMRAIP